MISLAPHWQDASARCAVPGASRTAAVRHDGCGLSVVGLIRFAPQALAAGAASAAPAIDAFIDRKLEQYGLTETTWRWSALAKAP